MAKVQTSCCVLTVRLKPELWQVHIIEKRFRIMEHLKNSLIGLELNHLTKVQRMKKYKNLMDGINSSEGAEQKNLYEERRELLNENGFSRYDFINAITPMQKHFVEHFAAQIVHRSASDVCKLLKKCFIKTARRFILFKRAH